MQTISFNIDFVQGFFHFAPFTDTQMSRLPLLLPEKKGPHKVVAGFWTIAFFFSFKTKFKLIQNNCSIITIEKDMAYDKYSDTQHLS